MQIYVGGVLNTRYAQDIKLNILESFYAIGRRELKIDKDYCKSFFLDSGAFSAWSQKKSINLDNYITYLKKNKDKINYYANLDEIGNAEKSQQNLERMEKEGLKPIPVYHYGENIEVFKKMCDKYPFIALGGMVPISTQNLIPWLNEVFAYICEKDGSTKIKIHGFGMTTFNLLTKYPWYSVDSVSPIMTAAMGGLYTEDGKTISVARSSKIPYSIQLYLKGELNNKKDSMKEFSFDTIRSSYKARIIINLRYIMELEEKLTENPPRYKNNQIKLL